MNKAENQKQKAHLAATGETALNMPRNSSSLTIRFPQAEQRWVGVARQLLSNGDN